DRVHRGPGDPWIVRGAVLPGPDRTTAAIAGPASPRRRGGGARGGGGARPRRPCRRRPVAGAAGRGGRGPVRTADRQLDPRRARRTQRRADRAVARGGSVRPPGAPGLG